MEKLTLVKYIRNNLEIFKQNFLLALSTNLIFSILYLLLVPVFRGISNLNQMYSAECLEKNVSLVMVILMVPVCKPEQVRGVQEIILSKQYEYYKIIAIRVVMAFFIALSELIIFASIMVMFKSSFPFVKYIIGASISGFSAGSLGLLGAIISGSTIGGYLISIGCYLLNWIGIINSKHIIYLFSMMEGSFQSKYILLMVGILSSLLGLLMLTKVKRF